MDSGAQPGQGARRELGRAAALARRAWATMTWAATRCSAACMHGQDALEPQRTTHCLQPVSDLRERLAAARRLLRDAVPLRVTCPACRSFRRRLARWCMRRPLWKHLAAAVAGCPHRCSPDRRRSPRRCMKAIRTSAAVLSCTEPAAGQSRRSAFGRCGRRILFRGEPYTTLLTTGNERTKITLWAALAGPSRRIGFAVVPELVHERRCSGIRRAARSATTCVYCSTCLASHATSV